MFFSTGTHIRQLIPEELSGRSGPAWRPHILFTKSMRMGKNIHVLKRGDHWSAVQEKAKRSSGNFRTQAEAVKRAKEIAKNNGQEVCIHGVDGRIREKNSYGNDPYPPEG